MADLTNVETELAARIQGVQTELANRGIVTVITTGWRSLDDQWRLYRAYKADPKHHPIAAYPGTSHHGTTPATAVDLALANPSKDNIKAHGEASKNWGLYRAVKSEYWHLELDPNRGPMPAGAPTVEDDVPQPFSIVPPSGRGRYTLHPDGKIETRNFDERNPLPFFGSMYDFPKEQSVPGRVFTNMQMVDQTTDDRGYWVFSNDGGAFKLDRKR